jgi:hypothetical protein
MRLEKSELEFIGFLRELTKTGRFEGAGLGIAKQVILSGQSSLNDRQRNLFNAALDKIIVDKCPVCQREVPWAEMALVVQTGACAECKPKTAN